MRAVQKGFTLIELMVAIAIIGIVSAIALPAYVEYLATADEAVVQQNVSTMRLFQEDFRLRTGAYASGTFDPGGAQTLNAANNIGWTPNDDRFVYVVVGGANSYSVTVTEISSGNTYQSPYVFP